MLFEACHSIFPEADLIGEETGILERKNEYAWIIDPLDGTVNFVHGLPAYCISVGLVKDEVPVAGCIYHISADEMYLGGKGWGAQMNGKPLSVSSKKTLRESLVGTGFPYAEFGTSSAYLSVMEEFIKKCNGVRRVGAAALDLAWVARGILDGFYEIGLKSWDIAAGIAIINEAGGQISNFKGASNVLFGRQIVASNSALHSQMLEVIGNHY